MDEHQHIRNWKTSQHDAAANGGRFVQVKKPEHEPKRGGYAESNDKRAFENTRVRTLGRIKAKNVNGAWNKERSKQNSGQIRRKFLNNFLGQAPISSDKKCPKKYQNIQ